jgi:VanZ family protein
LPRGRLSRSFATFPRGHCGATRPEAWERRPIGTRFSPTAGEVQRLRYARLWNALGVGFVLLVIYLSLAAPPRNLDLPNVFDVGHIVAYFWLTIWFAQIHRGARRRWAFAAGFGAMGIALEYIQGMTGYRQFDPADMVRNFIGVGIGLALAYTSLQDVLYRVERIFADSRD